MFIFRRKAKYYLKIDNIYVIIIAKTLLEILKQSGLQHKNSKDKERLTNKKGLRKY